MNHGLCFQYPSHLPLDRLKLVAAQASLPDAQVAFLVPLWVVLDQLLQQGFGSDQGLGFQSLLDHHNIRFKWIWPGALASAGFEFAAHRLAAVPQGLQSA